MKSLNKVIASLFLLGGVCLLEGCMARSSSFAPLPVVVAENVPLHQEGLPEPQNGCGWVVVNERKVTHFLGIRLNTEVRHFERALFYCCPGDEDPDPRCYQADWFYRSKK